MTAAGRRLLAALAVAAAAGAGWFLATRTGPRPDIVILLWDTTRADRLSALGYPRRTTPWLESLAAGGVRYTQCRAPSPWTVPSHASIFTGHIPRVHGAVDLQSPLSPHHRTLAERLREAGYDTILVSNNPLVGTATGLAQGFDRVLFVPESMGRPGVGQTLAVLREELALRGRDPRRAARPLFLFVNLMEPHLPYDPPDTVERPWRPEGAGERDVAEARKFEFPMDMAHNLGLRKLPQETLSILSALYDAEIRTLDDGCAGIEGLLAETGVLDAAEGGYLLAVTADHGENIGEHGLVDHKLSLADNLLHIPLVIRSPGRFEGGGTVNTQVRLQDLFPTLLEVAGAPAKPEDAPRAASLLGSPAVERLQVADFPAPMGFLDGMRRFFPGAPEEAFRPFGRDLLAAIGPMEGGRRLKWNRVVERAEAEGTAVVTESLFDLVGDPGEERDLLAGPSPTAEDLEAARRLAGEADRWVGPR